VRDLFVSGFILAFLPTSFRRPFIGLLLFTLLAYMRVQDLTWGFARYQRWKDLALATAASALENLGFRQVTAFWRAMGAWSAIRRSRQTWGVMTRTGFNEAP